MAAQENHVEVVKYLLDHSADHTIITQVRIKMLFDVYHNNSRSSGCL